MGAALKRPKKKKKIVLESLPVISTESDLAWGWGLKEPLFCFVLFCMTVSSKILKNIANDYSQSFALIVLYDAQIIPPFGQ